MKYVDIYDVTPDYVYMGYTPGYLNAYVYGPTVVYGTGYYYRPWYGHYYYPRPYTWGFGIRYNPWFGWGFGLGFGYDWFNVSIGFGNAYPWGYWGNGGWWGPRVYRPCYYGPSNYYRGGYYGYNSYNSYRRQYNNVTVVNNYYYNNNIYRNRRGVATRDYPRYNGPDRNPRYGGYNGGRQDVANNGRFSSNGNRTFDRNNGRVDPNYRNSQNGMYNRERLAPGNGNNREWRSPGNSDRIGQPQNRERFTNPSNGNRGGWNNNPTPQNDRVQQPQNRQPVRNFEQPGGNRWENRTPQRAYEPSSGGNRGSYGENRNFTQPSRPMQPQSNGPAPRSFERGGGGNGGGGGFSRPSSSGNNNGGGNSSGGSVRRRH
jgi:uncharacterized membrane protein YgcG